LLQNHLYAIIINDENEDDMIMKFNEQELSDLWECVGYFTDEVPVDDLEEDAEGRVDALLNRFRKEFGKANLPQLMKCEG